MQNEIIIILMTTIAALCGSLLTRIAPEEMKDGKPYFRYLYSITGGLVIAIVLWPFFGKYAVSGILGITVAGLLYLKHDIRFSTAALSVLLPVTIIKTTGVPSFIGVTSTLGVSLFICTMTGATIASRKVSESRWNDFFKAQWWIVIMMIIDLGVYYFA